MILHSPDSHRRNANFQLPYQGLNGSGRCPKHIAFQQTDETVNTWQYFGSHWYETLSGQVCPLSDCGPRILLVTTVGS